MSKISQKGRGIDFDGDDTVDAPSPKREERPRTGIGAISASLAMGRGVEEENRTLKEKVASLETREFVEKLDPTRIRASRWANRHPASFEGQEFATLREEIVSAGRNVQPIKVRPVVGDAKYDFELVYGHRRHRACLELGLPVAAVVAEVNDQQLYAEMERENRDRASLSPWEQGMHYRRALDGGLYPSMRQLSVAIGAPLSNVSMAVQLASLPEEVVSAFPSPLVLQYRWATPLSEALKKDAEAVVRRAKEITALGMGRAPKSVLEDLLGTGTALEGQTLKFKSRGKAAATFAKDGKGAVTIKVKAGVLSEKAERELAKFVEELLRD
ncbi:ParB/RepB/Spo0J family partition protein [uncultured Variovorax sp.]|jgi:ParB family chromosome partitioning protein|uniref:ParB/RepB/Spo0J family partition protein n=1 Tax=uncultured Variovorax sp. TaxID=114708 RepID=UPI00262FF700|nr:ParB/RepB/Spo0J family partition protein [uncultured Variovorax sp.]